MGKTLTAQSLAEKYMKPLYVVCLSDGNTRVSLTVQVPAGQIGVEPTKVEELLTVMFETASRWRAVLLIDEADIFLTERSTMNSQANALVSVFLRQLEEHECILILTTNLLQSFDKAIISRIHVALGYDQLKKDTRKELWRSSLQAETTHEDPVCSDKELDRLAEKELNGREVRDDSTAIRPFAYYESR